MAVNVTPVYLSNNITPSCFAYHLFYFQFYAYFIIFTSKGENNSSHLDHWCLNIKIAWGLSQAASIAGK